LACCAKTATCIFAESDDVTMRCKEFQHIGHYGAVLYEEFLESGDSVLRSSFFLINILNNEFFVLPEAQWVTSHRSQLMWGFFLNVLFELACRTTQQVLLFSLLTL
jgi:hypothetical protein